MQDTISLANEWEQRLERGLRLWRQLQQKASPIEEWVEQAEKLLSDTTRPTDELIVRHKVRSFVLFSGHFLSLLSPFVSVCFCP